jgi:hypothetical protein
LRYDGLDLNTGMSKEKYTNLLNNGGLGEESVQWNTNNFDYADEIRK